MQGRMGGSICEERSCISMTDPLMLFALWVCLVGKIV
jgi:hypothetical protein